jgi:hypothetical protein
MTPNKLLRSSRFIAVLKLCATQMTGYEGLAGKALAIVRSNWEC